MPACRELTGSALDTEPIVVQQAPFADALRTTFEYGLDSGAEILVTVDADTLPRPGKIRKLVKAMRPNDDELHGFALCALLFAWRKLGPRVYRVSSLPRLVKALDGNDTRPESSAIRRAGLASRSVRVHAAFHDFQQWRRDLFIKGRNHAAKHQRKKMERAIIEAWDRRENPEYRAYLAGLCAEPTPACYDGAAYNAPDWIEERGPLSADPVELLSEIEEARFDAV